MQAANNNQRICAWCGEPFTGGPPSKKFCCRECMRKNKDANRDRGAGQPERSCEVCGTRFRRKASTRDAAKCCSRECGFEYLAKKRVNVAKVLLVSVTLHRKRCVQCNGRFSCRSIQQVTCSDECRKARSAHLVRQQAVEANDNKFVCRECGDLHDAEYGSKRRVFCSIACSRRNAHRVARRKERARLKSGVFVENVNPFVVFDRDGWTCRLCGVDTPREARGTYEDNAPELDHIVPLSLNGDHSYANTQCLCRRCNARKGATLEEELDWVA